MNEAYENRNHEVEKESFPAPPERTPIRFPAFTPCGEELILTETGHPCGPGGPGGPGGDAPAGIQESLAEMISHSDRVDASPDARASNPSRAAELGSLSDSGDAPSPSESGNLGTGTPTTGPETRAGKQVSLAEAASPSNSGNIGTGTPTVAYTEETTQPTPILPQEGNPEPQTNDGQESPTQPAPPQEQSPNAEANGTLSQKLNQGAETPCMAAAPSPPQEQSPNAVLNTLRPLLEALCQGLANAAATPPQWQNPVSAPPPQQQETPAELAARVLSSPEALKAFEEMRMRQAEAVRRSLPILTPSRGQSTSPALAPDLPATMEEAAERARKIFGL